MIAPDIKAVNEFAAKAEAAKPAIYEYVNGKALLSAAFIRLRGY